MKGILEKIESLGWKEFEIFEVVDGNEKRVGDQRDWEWIQSEYDVRGKFKLISEIENELRFVAVHDLMNEVIDGKEIISPPVETTLIIRKS